MKLKLLPIERLDSRQDAALRQAGYLTFDGWRQRDRGVIKGQKAKEFNSHGKALFHESQTTEYPVGHFFRDQDDGGQDYDLFDGDPWSLS